MTPDTCPHCGAPVEHLMYRASIYQCGSVREQVGQGDATTQHPECARYVRTRISQLKHMAKVASDRAFMLSIRSLNYREEDPAAMRLDRKSDQLKRFSSACLREIDRLRGGA
jgi:hypothetical protein